MKKQTMFILTSVLLATLLSPVSVSAVADTKVSVMVEAKDQMATAPTEQKEGTMQEKSTYALPYPGILADHPLYFFKKLRDQILEKLISDPIRKVEFYVLQSDKALNAGVFLQAKGKLDVSVESIVQAGDHMDSAVKSANAFKTQNREIPAYVIERFTNSLAKHEEVLNELLLPASGTYKEKVSSALELVKKQQGVVATLK